MNEQAVHCIKVIVSFMAGVFIGVGISGGISILRDTISTRRAQRNAAKLRESADSISELAGGIAETSGGIEEANGNFAESNGRFDNLLDQIESQKLDNRN